MLGLERVDVTDNFFDLGGDSLLILRLHRRIEEELGRNLRVLDLFRFPSVRALAERFEEPARRPSLERARRLGERRKAARGRRRRVPRRPPRR